MREKILQFLRQRPFTPFFIRLSNQSPLWVKHPEQAMVAPGYIEVGVPKDDRPGPEVAGTIFVSLLHIAEVGVADTSVPIASNGEAGA